MWFTDKFFAAKKKPKKSEALIDLDLLTLLFENEILRIRSTEPRPALIRARLADGFRSVGLSPLAPNLFDSETESFDEEAWRRLALSVSCLDDEDISWGIFACSERKSVKSLVLDGFIHLARERVALTMDLLYESELRMEEYARHMAGELGLMILGESEDESAKIRYRLDYARLLEEADKARLSAQERIEYLQKLQEEEQAKRAPRGKW
ncbi:MAG: hypothetical protein P1V97_36680 [Planctomycetota bacterium]|nr:hypothetical protein [Planctomycetota bacterium]